MNELLPHEPLYLLAEISAVFLGFAIIAASIRNDSFDRVRLVSIVLCASWVMIAVFTPLWLASTGLNESIIIKISAVVFLSLNTLGWVLQYFSLAKLGTALSEWRVTIPIYVLEAVIWLGLLFALFSDSTIVGSIYLLCVIGLFFQILIFVIAMVLKPDSD